MTGEEKAFIEMGTKYKNVFSSMEGQAVLKHIIWNVLGTFGTKKGNEGDMALSNAGAMILNYVACSDANYTSDVITMACIEAQPITIKQEEAK